MGWAKVSLQKIDGKLTTIFEPDARPPETAYEPGEWSPDGRYFVIIRVINIRYPNTTKQDMGFIIDTKKGKTVELDSSILAGFDHTNYSWVAGKPHSMELQDMGKREIAEPADD